MIKNIAQKTTLHSDGTVPGSGFGGLSQGLFDGMSEDVVRTSSLPGSADRLVGASPVCRLAAEAPLTTVHAAQASPHAAEQGAVPSVLAAPERIHPALWRASQIARSPGLYANTGYPDMSAQLPGGGWPLGNLIEVMTPRAGIGEIQLFRPTFCQPQTNQLHPDSPLTGANSSAGQRPIVLIQPPYRPQVCAWAHWGIAPSRLLWLSPQSTADALWAAEHILNSGAFAALLLWQDALRDGALRRLQLSAQKGDTLFVLVRSLAAARHASPAPLRLVLQPEPAGLQVHIVKRRGSVSEHPVHLSFYSHASGGDAATGGVADPYSAVLTESHHANMDSRTSATPHAGHTLS